MSQLKTKLIKDFHKRFAKQVDEESRFVIADPKEVEDWLESSFDAIREETICEVKEEINNIGRIRGEHNHKYVLAFDEDDVKDVLEKLKEKDRTDL